MTMLLVISVLNDMLTETGLQLLGCNPKPGVCERGMDRSQGGNATLLMMAPAQHRTSCRALYEVTIMKEPVLNRITGAPPQNSALSHRHRISQCH